MAWERFYSGVAANPDFTHFVEVGVFEGKSLIHLASELKKSGRPFTLHAVDLWERASVETDYARVIPADMLPTLKQKLKEHGLADCIGIVEGESTKAATQFRDGSLDVVYIDANHDYAHVKADIEAWLPKIRKGGILSGHDYGEPCAVKEVVDEKFSSSVVTMGTVWYIHVGLVIGPP